MFPIVYLTSDLGTMPRSGKLVRVISLDAFKMSKYQKKNEDQQDRFIEKKCATLGAKMVTLTRSYRAAELLGSREASDTTVRGIKIQLLPDH